MATEGYLTLVLLHHSPRSGPFPCPADLCGAAGAFPARGLWERLRFVIVRVLLTGVSGTGKSSLVKELRRRGYVPYDADDDGFTHPLPDQHVGMATEPRQAPLRSARRPALILRRLLRRAVPVRVRLQGAPDCAG